MQHGQVDLGRVASRSSSLCKLGGRPRLPTSTERREAALDALVPGSLRALAAHLGDAENPNPAAWRAALKVLELRFGPAAPEPEEVSLPISADDVTGMSWQQLQLLAARLVVGEAPEHISAITTGEPAKT